MTPHDIAGQKFERLTAIHRVRPAPGASIWLFQCECGAQKEISLGHVRSGRTKSCGCIRKERLAERNRLTRPRDVTGQRYGKLVAIEDVGRQNGRVLWRCQCDCGGEKIVSSMSLLIGDVGSCGCAIISREVVRSEARRAYGRVRAAHRRQTDPKYNLEVKIRNAVNNALRRGGGKTSPLCETLGYTIDELKSHLEKTMPPGRTWADVLSGELHIDHRIPLSAFNFTNADDYDFKRAWALSNLRLLEALPNLIKGNRLNTPFQPSLI